MLHRDSCLGEEEVEVQGLVGEGEGVGVDQIHLSGPPTTIRKHRTSQWHNRCPQMT